MHSKRGCAGKRSEAHYFRSQVLSSCVQGTALLLLSRMHPEITEPMTPPALTCSGSWWQVAVRHVTHRGIIPLCSLPWPCAMPHYSARPSSGHSRQPVLPMAARPA